MENKKYSNEGNNFIARASYPARIGMGLAFVGLMFASALTPVIIGTNMKKRNNEYLMQNRDPSAITIDENPLITDFRGLGGIEYEDTDNDGDYDSILSLRLRQDIAEKTGKDYIRVPIRKNPNGTISIGNLENKLQEVLNSK